MLYAGLLLSRSSAGLLLGLGSVYAGFAGLLLGLGSICMLYARLLLRERLVAHCVCWVQRSICMLYARLLGLFTRVHLCICVRVGRIH